MYFGDEWACCIDGGELSLFCDLSDFRAYAMRGEDDNGILWYLVDLFDEDDAALFEAVDDMFIVYDFVVDEDWPEVGADIEYLVDDFDGHDYAGTETTGIGKVYTHIGGW